MCEKIFLLPRKKTFSDSLIKFTSLQSSISSEMSEKYLSSLQAYGTRSLNHCNLISFLFARSKSVRWKNENAKTCKRVIIKTKLSELCKSNTFTTISKTPSTLIPSSNLPQSVKSPKKDTRTTSFSYSTFSSPP